MVGSLNENMVTGFQRGIGQRLTAGKRGTLNPAASSRKHLMVCNRKGIQQLHSKLCFMFDLFVIFVYSFVSDLKSDFNSQAQQVDVFKTKS